MLLINRSAGFGRYNVTGLMNKAQEAEEFVKEERGKASSFPLVCEY